MSFRVCVKTRAGITILVTPPPKASSGDDDISSPRPLTDKPPVPNLFHAKFGNCDDDFCPFDDEPGPLPDAASLNEMEEAHFKNHPSLNEK